MPGQYTGTLYSLMAQERLGYSGRAAMWTCGLLGRGQSSCVQKICLQSKVMLMIAE